MTDPLASARFSVEHANAYISDVQALARAFFKSEPYAVFLKPDPLYPTHQLEYLRQVKPLPARIHGLAADAVKNLRSALDHLCYDVALAAGKSGKNAHFPFGDDIAEAQSRAKHRAKDIPRELFDLMVAFKPYKGGNDTLWRLNKLANTSKHESFLRTVLLTQEMTITSPGISLTKDFPRDGTEDEVVIGWFRRGTKQPHHELTLDTSIRFSDVGDLTFNRPAVELLHDFSSVVQRVILAVEAQGKRLGILK